MTDREAQIREMAKKTIVLRLPEMDSVAVRRDEAYFVDDEGVLLMDVYTPAAANGAAPPVVVSPCDAVAEVSTHCVAIRVPVLPTAVPPVGV